MIARTKSDLRDLFKYTLHTNYNKFWRKALNGNSNWNYREDYERIGKGLTEIKICQDTIQELKKIKFRSNMFIYILQNTEYTDNEIDDILEDNIKDIDWFGLYDRNDISFDKKVKYYKEIKASWYKKPHSTFGNVSDVLKDIEREYKIRELLEET